MENRDDIAFTRGALKGLEGRLNSLDQEVNKLQHELEALERQRALLKRHIDIRESLNVPVSKLSPSIIRKIFYYCLPYGRNPTMSNKEAPTSLCQVCRRWRQLAFDSPELWASIHIPLSIPPDSRYLFIARRQYESTQLQGISSWLLRSKDLPLSISLTAGCTLLQTVSPLVIEQTIAPYLKVLSSFSSRWRLIQFNIHSLDWIQHFFRYKTSELPLLEKIHLDGLRCDVGKFTNARVIRALSKVDSFLRCPKLRWVSLPLLGELITEVPVQWSQITALNLVGASNCPLSRIMTILASCRKLETLSVCFDFPPTPINLSLERTVTLFHLMELCVIDRCTTYDSPRFFNHLCAPNLRSLWYDRSTPPAQWLSHIITPDSLSQRLFRSMRAFTSRSQQPIEEFALGYDWLTEDDLFGFLFLLPDLKRLSLRGAGLKKTTPVDDLRPAPLCFDSDLLKLLLTIPERQDIDFAIISDASIFGEFDGSDSESEGGDSSTTTSNNDRKSRILKSTDDNEDEEGCREVYNFLCPKLEVFHCTGASFSGPSILNLLRSRSLSDKRFGISRIRAVDITFGLGVETFPETVIEEIKSLADEAGIRVFLHFLHFNQVTPPALPPNTPYDGLYSVGFGNHREIPVFTGMF